MERKIIAIDGAAGTGKSTLAEKLAAKLGWPMFSTGRLYRAVELLAHQHSVPESDSKELCKLLDAHQLQVVKSVDQNILNITLDGAPVDHLLYSDQVPNNGSKVAALREIREALIPIQRSAAPASDLVVEGRDIGSAIFPEALVKFFIIVPSAEVRATRRALQKLGREPTESERSEIIRDLEARDLRDAGREFNPTKQPEDALVIDNSSQPLTEIVEKMYNYVLCEIRKR
ncbi:MAG TPA: (d)CMP kinase [Oligoflexia bacterium]|nr:(d)CMP kinase [Oligoflexia bacterium]HMP27102.1 (d)CMP kinase [Oligoflexia bacterium]